MHHAFKEKNTSRYGGWDVSLDLGLLLVGQVTGQGCRLSMPGHHRKYRAGFLNTLLTHNRWLGAFEMDSRLSSTDAEIEPLISPGFSGVFGAEADILSRLGYPGLCGNPIHLRNPGDSGLPRLRKSTSVERLMSPTRWRTCQVSP